MRLQVLSDYRTLSRHVASEIISQVKQNPRSVLCLAAGDTPREAYNLLAEMAHHDKTDFSQCTFIGLDEWIGIPPDNEGSCYFFLRQNLFEPLGIAGSQVNTFDGLSKDDAEQCAKVDSIIFRKGGIDLMLVGVGMNGHIGFNEPGVEENLYSHVIELDETTRSVGQKYFKESTELRKGITLGLRHIMESRRLIVMASGTKKAEIMRKILEGPISNQVPASIVRKHQNASTMVDRDAAGALTII